MGTLIKGLHIFSLGAVSADVFDVSSEPRGLYYWCSVKPFAVGCSLWRSNNLNFILSTHIVKTYKVPGPMIPALTIWWIKTCPLSSECSYLWMVRWTPNLLNIYSMMNDVRNVRAGRNGIHLLGTQQDYIFLNPELISKISSVMKAKQEILGEGKGPKL